jgi:hypothetical protein
MLNTQNPKRETQKTKHKKFYGNKNRRYTQKELEFY